MVRSSSNGHRFSKDSVNCAREPPVTEQPTRRKGAGEGAIIPIGGLMANAVANALASFGAMPNQLPLSPARVWHIGSAKKATDNSA